MWFLNSNSPKKKLSFFKNWILPKKRFISVSKNGIVISQQKNGHPHKSICGPAKTGIAALGLQKKVSSSSNIPMLLLN